MHQMKAIIFEITDKPLKISNHVQSSSNKVKVIIGP